MLDLQRVPIDVLKSNPRNARTHSRAQIRQLADSIATFGFVVPMLIDKDRSIIAGHGRLEAAKLLGLREVPVIVVQKLSEAKRRALGLADNKIASNAGWDRERLAVELAELSELLKNESLNIEITGFIAPEIDGLALDFEDDSSDPADTVDPAWSTAEPVTKPGELWRLGSHRLLCGDARNGGHLALLMGDSQAAMLFCDPPYNLRVRHIGGRGRIKHREFSMASGELSRAGFIEFLEIALSAAAAVSRNGAVHFVFIDWRHIDMLFEAARTVYGEILNLAVWVKSNGGQGAFYRSQHELVGIFRVGDAPHSNNIELGRHGRNRSNVWQHAGVNAFRAGRLSDLQAHPTPKPVGLVADAIKDCTRRRDVVLDTFSGSGTTILAAERVGRRGFGVEIEPRYVDVAIRRWQAFTRRDAIHAQTGITFDELASERQIALANVTEGRGS